MLFIVTWRPEDLSAERRMLAFLSSITRLDSLTRLSLAPLNAPDVEEFVALEWGKVPSGEFVHRLREETNGVPYLLASYLESGADELLAQAGESWPIPEGIKGLLNEKLSSAGGVGMQLLAAAAVVGRAFDFDTLLAVSGRGEDEAIEAIEELIALRIINERDQANFDGSPVYDFSHDTLRTLVYLQTSAARKRLLHRRAANALLSLDRRWPSRDGASAQIARHYQASGDAESAAQHFKAAGDNAKALFANADAVVHYQSALGANHPDTVSLHIAIGDALTLLGRYAEALSSYEQAAALAPEGKTAWIEGKLGAVYARIGEWELADSHYGDAQEALDHDPEAAQRAGLLVERGFVAFRRGDPQQAVTMASEALAVALDLGDIATEAQARNILGMLAKHRGDVIESREQLQVSLDLAIASKSIPAVIAAKNNLALAYASADPDRAMSLADEALELSRQQGDRHREAALLSNLADLLHAAGKSVDAMARVEESVAIYADIGIQAGAYQPEIWKLAEW